jgi:subtilisin family serine protease
MHLIENTHRHDEHQPREMARTRRTSRVGRRLRSCVCLASRLASRIASRLALRLALIVCSVAAGVIVGGARADFIPERVLILADDAGQGGAIQKFADIGFTLNPTVDYTLFQITRYEIDPPPTAADIPILRAVLDSLIGSNTIESGDFDIPVAVETGQGQTGSIWVSCLGFPNFYGQYGSTAVGAPFAAERGYGQGVRIGIVDSGLVPNAPVSEALSASFGYACANGVATLGVIPRDIGDGIDQNGVNGPDEGVGHGTFVAGIASLVAPGARHIHLKVLDDEGMCFLSDVLAALQACIEENVHVVNLSLVPSAPTDILACAIHILRNSGAIVVACAGNDPNMTNRYYPAVPNSNCTSANDTDLIQVGASTFGDGFWSQGAMGTWVDLFAPGVTNYNGFQLPIPGESLLGPIGYDSQTQSACFASASGTSFSAAWVSGAAACWRAAYGTLPGGGIAADQISGLFLADARQTGTAIGGTSSKRLNAAALVALTGGAPQCPPDIVPNFDPITGEYVYSIDAADLSAALGLWGLKAVDPRQIFRADLDGDGTIGAIDLGTLLGIWGNVPPNPCP